MAGFSLFFYLCGYKCITFKKDEYEFFGFGEKTLFGS